MNGNVSVLVVEDDPEIAAFLKGLLADRYSVSFVSHGAEAINRAAAKESDYAVVVLDYRLPDISGLEVLRKIRKIRPQVPVIFMTGYGDEDIAVRAFRYGVRDYLKKPFSYAEFLQVLEGSLSWTHADGNGRSAPDDSHLPAGKLASNDKAVKYTIQKAVIYIHNNYTSRITLDKVAREACTSKHHFSREFKRSLGCTYRDYVNRLRIDKAKELLKNPRFSVTEAAFSVGYPDLTNFERIFKKTVGCTPRDYKNGAQTAEGAAGTAASGSDPVQ